MTKTYTVIALAVLATCAVLVSLMNGCAGPAYSVEYRRHAPAGADSSSRYQTTVATRHDANLPPRLGEIPAVPELFAQADSLHRAAPAGSLPSLDEEVWVIVKPSAHTVAPPQQDDIPGCGALMCRVPSPNPGREPRDVPMPLEHTEVRTQISAYIASVNVTQQFHNPYSSKIEAVYAFPLPQNAAVNGFIMTIGDRKIRGIIREREEAQQIYDDAKAQGYVASLLTQERPNIFIQHVANIAPRHSVDVDITYFHTLRYDDGWYEYVFPMVVGPRFNPPTSAGDGIGAVAHGHRGASGQSTEVHYLRPNERSGHDIGVTVDIAAGVHIEEIDCTSHRVDVTRTGSEQMRVTLRDADTIPNKDFVLRYRVAGETVKTALLTHRDPYTGQGYFTFMLIPPRTIEQQVRQPMEMIFVIDCSGSMQGEPIEQCKAAIDHALTHLEPSDTFQIVVFSNDASQLGKDPLPATRENIRRGREYVRNLQSGGGTMMITGMRAALKFRHDPERLRVVTFLTDGYIGNESEILREEAKRLGAGRVFSFGVGSSVNRFLLERMAKLGRGAVAYLGPNDSGATVMDAFFSRVSNPVLSNLDVDWGDMQVRDVVVSGNDLFVGRPVVYTGTFAGTTHEPIRVRGTAGGGHIVEATFHEDLYGGAASHPALPCVWARMQIADLMDRAIYEGNRNLERDVMAIALRHSLLSAFTSFVAVDSSSRTAGSYGTTVHVGVPVPDGVKYETTVPQDGSNH